MIRSKLRTQIAVLLVIPCLLFSVGVVLMSFRYLLQFFKSTQQDSLQKMSGQIMFSLKNSVDDINSMLVNIESNGIINGRTDNLENVIGTIYKYRGTYIKGIVFIGNDGTVIGSPTTYWFFGDKEKGIIQDMVAKNNTQISWSSHFYSTIDTSSNDYQALSIAVKPVYYNQQYIGALGIVISLSEFLSNTALYNGNYDISTYLYESDQTLADDYQYRRDESYSLTPYSSQPEEMRKTNTAIRYLNKRNMYFSEAEMSTNPHWSIIIVGDVYKLQSKFQPFNNKIMTVIITGLGGLLVIYMIFIQWWFTTPMKSLSRGIRQLSGGDFTYRIPLRRKDEFGEIAEQFNHMSKMMKELIEKVQTISQQKSESEMNVLLSQINPHFLYNTLDVINIMVDISPKDKVHEAFEKLVRLLRYGLDKKNLHILDEELDYIRNYIDLLRIRYGDGFDYTVEKGDGTGGKRILKLILQPLVENAVFHGILPLKDRQGHIVVKTALQDDNLLIEITDNGVGMSEEKIREVLSGGQRETRTGGIGVSNVFERIRLYYGDNYSFAVESKEKTGTTIRIRFPAQPVSVIREEGEEHDGRET